ncbi:MAG: hypothetical protein M3N18_02460 [Actinomycetota bacterium]|nr:hypothetical protein [Actinomycetota bacterium]
MARKKAALRSDTTLAPTGRPENEVYVRGLPVCCLGSLKEEIVARPGGGPDDRRILELECGVCGKHWVVTSSLDDRVLDRFVTHGGPRVAARSGGKYPAA